MCTFVWCVCRVCVYVGCECVVCECVCVMCVVRVVWWVYVCVGGCVCVWWAFVFVCVVVVFDMCF